MNELIEYLPFRIFVGILITLFGACIGSFGLCVSERYNTNIKDKRSRCNYCGKNLKLHELIPIFSFIFLKGRCASCKGKIGIECLISEIVSSCAFAIIYISYGINLSLLKWLLFFSVLYIAALIDLKHRVIPNICTLLLIILWGAFEIFDNNNMPGILDSILGGILVPALLTIVSLFMNKLLGKETLGMGDIKILSGIGLIFGFGYSILNIFFMCIVGLLIPLFVKKYRRKAFPLMPAIATASVLTLLFGKKLLEIYIGLL